MAGSPPPPKPKPEQNVIPINKPRRERGDATQSFELHRREDDTERTEIVITDEGPPTDRIDVPPQVRVPRPQKIKDFSPPPGEIWDVFSVIRVPAEKKLVSLYEPVTTAYAILEGEAEERSLDKEMNLHRVRTLSAGCLVNPGLFDEARAHNQSSVEVIATTDMIVYAIAIDDLDAYDVPEDRRTAMRIKRDRYVRSRLAREADPSLSGRNHFFEKVKELNQLLKSELELRIKEVSEKSIAPVRRENAILKAWLEMFFAHNVPELIDEVWRLRKDQAADSQSLNAMLETLRRSVEDQDADIRRYLEERVFIIAFAVSVIEIALESGNRDEQQKAIDLLNNLHARKIGVADFFRRPLL
jgi:hypothetical protein